MTIAALNGSVFGRLTVLSVADRGHRTKTEKRWICVCSCGSFVTAPTNALTRGTKKSCGCLAAESRAITKRTHGQSRTRGYVVWLNMMRRCEKEDHPTFKHYGARGIVVCDRWRDVELFLQDMGQPPDGKSLERIDNDLGYSPENCCWATQKEQLRNRRKTIQITVNEETRCLADWCERMGLKYGLIYDRIRRGASPEDALKLSICAEAK